MRAGAAAVVVLSAFTLGGCGGSPSPAAPGAVVSPGQTTSTGFGTIVPGAPASSGDNRLSRCLQGSRDASCFSANSLAAPTVLLSVPASRETRVGTRATGTNPPNPPSNLAAFITRSGRSSTANLYWQAPTTGPTATDYLIEAGSSPATSDLAAFRTGSTNTYFITLVSGPGSF